MKTVFPVKQYSTLKCEALCAELMSNGIPFNAIHIQLNGSARKRFSQDIELVELETGANDEDIQKVTIQVNRDGLYDLLPEGLFHLPATSMNDAGIVENRVHHRRLKEEEKNARKFFQPFEQEFMHYACNVELLERETTQSILSGDVLHNLHSILEIPHELPAQTASILAQLMPWVYLVKSNPAATVTVLNILLNKKVTLHQQNSYVHEAGSTVLNSDTPELGNNFVLGSCCNDPVQEWTFNIHGIEPDEMALYTGQQPYQKLLIFFTEIFIPVEVEVKFHYYLKETAPKAINQILGYGSIL